LIDGFIEIQAEDLNAARCKNLPHDYLCQFIAYVMYITVKGYIDLSTYVMYYLGMYPNQYSLSLSLLVVWKPFLVLVALGERVPELVISPSASQGDTMSGKNSQKFGLALYFFKDTAQRKQSPNRRKFAQSGANPTIASYNASAVKIYSAVNSMARF
jgi:hypothetical protein